LVSRKYDNRLDAITKIKQRESNVSMNIDDAVEAIITISIGYMGDMKKMRIEISDILQELYKGGKRK